MTLEAIQARLDASSPRPWEKHRNRIGWGWLTSDRRPDADLRLGMTEADADFIAHAPTDLADLLAEVRRLRSEETTTTQETILIF